MPFPRIRVLELRRLEGCPAAGVPLREAVGGSAAETRARRRGSLDHRERGCARWNAGEMTLRLRCKSPVTRKEKREVQMQIVTS